MPKTSAIVSPPQAMELIRDDVEREEPTPRPRPPPKFILSGLAREVRVLFGCRLARLECFVVSYLTECCALVLVSLGSSQCRFHNESVHYNFLCLTYRECLLCL